MIYKLKYSGQPLRTPITYFEIPQKENMYIGIDKGIDMHTKQV